MCSLFDLHWDRGWDFYKAEKFEEAIAQWRVAADLDPEDGYVLNNIGAALSKLGKKEEAITEWRKAAQLEPNYDKPHTNLAHALTDGGFSLEALAAVRAAICLRSDDVYLYNHLGFHLLVQADENKDKAGWEAAAAAFQQAVEIEPTNSYARRYLARTQWARGKKREAIATSKAAIVSEPDNLKAYKQLAGYQVCAGSLRSGIRTIRAIYALSETDEINQYVADGERLTQRVLLMGAGLTAVLVGVWIWNRRRGK